MPLDIKSRFVIAAETTGQSSIDGLSRSVGNVEQGVSRLPSVVKSAASAFAGFAVAGVTALAAATKGAIDYASAIVDAAEQTGLGVESFQALRFAAGQAGISAEEFVSAMQRFNTTVGAAANGSKAQADLFARLGVAIRDANGDVRSGEAILNDFADGLSRIDSPAQQARASAEAFGRAAGPKLAVLLREGSDGLAELQRQAREAGAVLSEDTARRAEEAGDKLEALSGVLKVQMADALVSLIPLLTSAGQKLADFAVEAGKLFDRLQEGTLENLAGKLGGVEQAIRKAAAAAAEAGRKGDFEERNRQLSLQIAQTERLVNLRRQYNDLLRPPGGSPASGGGDAAAGVVGETAAEIAARKAAAAAAARAAKAAQRDSTDFAGADAIRSADADAEYYRNLQQSVDGFIRSADEELPRLLDDVTASVQESSGATVDAYLEAFEAMEDIADAAAANIADTLTDGVFAFVDDGVDGMVKSFNRALRQIAADILNSSIRQALRSVFTDALGQGGSGGGGYGDLFAAVIGAFAGGTGKTGSASVSKNAAGGSFIVPGPNSGDRVIPIFRANGGERVDITPAGASRGGSGVQIVNNVDARGADPASEARIQQAIRDSERRTIAQVAQLAKRGRL